MAWLADHVRVCGGLQDFLRGSLPCRIQCWPHKFKCSWTIRDGVPVVVLKESPGLPSSCNDTILKNYCFLLFCFPLPFLVALVKAIKN